MHQLLTLIFTTISLLLLLHPPLSFSTSRQNLSHSQPPELGFRVGLTRIHSNSPNLSNLQLLRRSIDRSKNRLKKINSMIKAHPPPPPYNDAVAQVHIGDGEFLMNLSIGTPGIPFSGIMDTGSDLIWTQCSPCVNCFDQSTQIFDPKKSSTFSNVSCSSDLCRDADVFRCDRNCKYLYTYGDKSSTQGFLAMDTITFDDSMSIPNLGFGCGVNNQGTSFGQGSGLVGLGRGPLSLTSQLNISIFSYCLTSILDNVNKTSSLLLGSLANNYAINISKTPLIRNPSQPSFYYIGLEEITVGETLISIPKKSRFRMQEDGTGGMIIDSGTTISYIEKGIFEAIKEEMVLQTKLRVSEEDDNNSTGLDLCFDLPLTAEDAAEVLVPRLKFQFEGGLELELPAENYMVFDEAVGLVCLAMGASDGISILGNIQQQNFLVVHDLDKESLSFLPMECGQL